MLSALGLFYRFPLLLVICEFWLPTAMLPRLVWPLAAVASVASASPLRDLHGRANSSIVNQTTCNGNTYTYNALAGYGFVPASARDKFGDTLGGYGSSVAIDQSTWKKLANGSYTGTLWAIPDRGWYECCRVSF